MAGQPEHAEERPQPAVAAPSHTTAGPERTLESDVLKVQAAAGNNAALHYLALAQPKFAAMPPLPPEAPDLSAARLHSAPDPSRVHRKLQAKTTPAGRDPFFGTIRRAKHVGADATNAVPNDWQPVLAPWRALDEGADDTAQLDALLEGFKGFAALRYGQKGGNDWSLTGDCGHFSGRFTKIASLLGIPGVATNNYPKVNAVKPGNALGWYIPPEAGYREIGAKRPPNVSNGAYFFSTSHVWAEHNGAVYDVLFGEKGQAGREVDERTTLKSVLHFCVGDDWFRSAGTSNRYVATINPVLGGAGALAGGLDELTKSDKPDAVSRRSIRRRPVHVIRRVTDEVVDEHVKMGNARKVGGAIAELGKHGGLDSESGLIKPSKVKESMEGPDQMVLGCGRSWKKVKQKYLADEPKMRLLLQYRIHEVGTIYQQVIDRMWKENEPLRKRELAAKGSVDPQQLFQRNDLQFAMMGSTDLTSDYDVSFDHRVDKPWIGVAAVKIFNELFRAKWQKESGTVFDTNVYTQGFMPSDMSNIPTALPGAIDRRRQAAESGASGGGKEETRLLVAKLKKKSEVAAEVRAKLAEKAIEGRSKVRKNQSISQQQVFGIEDVMSLVKVRKFMSESEWAKYSEMLLSGLDGPAKASTQSVLEKADKRFAELDEQLSQRKAALKKKRGTEEVDEDDLELEASNRLYEEYLEYAAKIVAANKGVLEPGAMAKWTEQQSAALYFANEAYHTSGPVESTVIGQQMGIKMVQTSEQHLQAINEQSGFVVEQHHAAHGNNGRFLWKSAKYVDRICAILNLIRQDVKGALPSVLPLEADLRALSAALLVIKKGTAPDTDKDTASEERLKEKVPPLDPDVKACVLKLNADVNQRLRMAKSAAKG